MTRRQRWNVSLARIELDAQDGALQTHTTLSVLLGTQHLAIDWQFLCL
jgi:hypothetical protein